MNNGRMWCVVNPTVGLPLFLGGVITVSLIVHGSILSNTQWMGNFFSGSKASAARAEAVPAPSNLAQVGSDSGFAVSVTPVVAGGGQPTAFVITITPRAGEAPQTVTLVQRAESPPDGSRAPATAIR